MLKVLIDDSKFPVKKTIAVFRLGTWDEPLTTKEFNELSPNDTITIERYGEQKNILRKDLINYL
jgi:hypothetical protein